MNVPSAFWLSRASRSIRGSEEGRYIRVIYVPDPGPDSVFVVTAYELMGKPLTAYKRRRRKKQT
jgi:hypothetical protein